MADATDVVLTLTLAAIDTSAPAMVAFNARLAEQKTLLDASNTRMASAGAASEAMSARQAAAAEATYVRQETAAVKSYERQQIAAAKEVDAAEALYLRREAAALKTYEREQVAADASYQKQIAAAEAASAKQTAAIAKVGKGAGLLTLGLIGVGYETSKMASNFQRDMEMIHTQAGAPQAEVDTLSGKVLKLSSVVGFGPDSLANSLFHAESAGYREAAALDITANAAKLAQIGHADLETTTQALVGVMSSHIKGVKDAADATAYLNSIVGIGDTRLQAVAQSIGTGVLPAFANAGLGIRDFGAAMATMTDNLVPADEAATRLRMTVALLGAPSGAAAKALEAVGVSASDANAALSHRDDLAQYGIHLTDLATDLRKPDGLLVAIQDLKKHLENAGLSATEQAAVLTRAFGGGRSSSAILTLYNELDRLQTKYKDLGTGVQKFGDDWNKTTQTTAYQAAQAKANFEGLSIAVGQGLVPAVTELLKVVTPAAEAMAHFTADHKTFVADTLLLAGGAAASTAAVGGILKITAAWKTVKVAALGAQAAEDAAVLGPLALIAAPIIAGVYAYNKFQEATYKAQASTETMRQKFIESKATLDQYVATLPGAAGGLTKFGNSIDASAIASAKAAKASYEHQHAMEAQAAAAQHLGDKLLYGLGIVKALNAEQAKDPAAKVVKAPAIVDLTKEIADAQKHVNDAVNQANTDIEAYGHVLTAHQATLDRWKTTLQTLQDRLSRLTATLDTWTTANKAAENELKRLNATQQQMANEGLAKEQAAFTAMSDTAITQARRMKSGVIAEYDAMLVHITKSIPVAALSIPASARIDTPFLGPNQFSTKGPEGSPAASAVGLAPELGTSMAALTTAIHGLPPEFQGAFDSEITKFHSEEAALYKTYITDLNKENAADAAAINKINDTYHKQIAQNLADAQAKDKAEHDRYLAAIDGAESKHNTTLAGNLQTFNTNFATSLANYQAQVLQAQTKAASDATQHEDRLRQLEADNIAKLAAVHGKNAAERRAAIDADYAKGVRQENENYNRTVSHDEAHLQGLADAFDRHIKGIQATFDRQAKAANTQLAKDLSTAKGADKAALSGIQKWLDGKDNKAASDRQEALNKEAGIYVKVVHGIVEAFDKGKHLIAQAIKEGTTPAARLSTIQSGAQTAYDNAYAQVVIDILAHGKATKADIVALALATKTQDDLTKAQNKAKNSLYDLSVSVELLGAHIGRVGQPAPGVPSIATTVGGGGFAATAPGVITGGLALKNVFANLVTAGTAAIASQEQQTHANYVVAKNAGDTATEFSILDAAFLAGKTSLDGMPITLAGVVQAYNENQATVLATTRRLIDFDRATGNTADEFAQLQTLYHQGNASLAELTQAYNDNQTAVAKATAADLAFYVATGQFSAAMSSISTSLTGPLNDASAKLAYDFYTHSGNIEADTQSVKDHQAALDALTQATWDASYTAANPAQQSQMLNTLAQPMISAQSAQASSEQAVANAQLGVIAANSALEVTGINAMTTQIQDMGGIIKAESAVSTARFSGQLAALNDLIPIQNDLYAITKATNPQMLQTAQEQLKIDRLTAVMDQDKAAWDIKLAQMQLQLAQDKMAVDAANASAQMTVAFDNLTVAEDALNAAMAAAKLQSDSLVIQNAIHTDLGGVQDYLSLIDGDLQNLSAAQDQQMADQQQLGFDTGTANEIAAGGAGLLAGDQLGIDQATASAAASNQAYQLQLAQYKVEQNQQNLQQQLVNNQQQDNASLLSEIRTLQGIIRFQNSPASRRSLRSVGNVSTAQLINGWAATAASTQAA